nr:prolyl oligopeptidase family serine peptidase [uncultured Roseateles sp.]
MHERYAAAEKLLLPVGLPKVRNAALTVRWIARTNECWYRREAGDGHEWVVFDAQGDTHRPAFDHPKLAEALKAQGHVVEASKLAIDVKRLDSDGLEFSFEKSRFDYRMSTGELRRTGDVESSKGPSRSPDGRRLLSQHDGNLWLAEAGMEARQVTTDGSENDGYAIYHGNYKGGFVPRSRVDAQGTPAGVVWAPDSSKAIVWRIDQRHVEPYPLLETAPQDGSFRPKVHLPRIPLTGERPPTIRWFCLDMDSLALTPLQLPEDQLHLHQDWEAIREWMWSPDRSHAWAVMFGADQRAAYLLDIDLTTGKSRVVLSEADEPRVELNTSSYGSIGVAVVGNMDQVLWFSHRSGWGHLYLYDGNSGRLLNAVTEGEWLVRDLIDVDSQSGRVLFTAQGREGGNPYLRSLYRINLDGSGLRRLTPVGVDADVFRGLSAISKTTESASQLSPNGNYLVYARSNVAQAPQTVVVRLEDGQETVIEEADVSGLLAAGYVPPEEFVTLAADGKTEIYGLLYRPPVMRADGKAPLLVAQYASPLMAGCPRTYLAAVAGPGQWISPAAFAALGSAVIALDARGTTGRSRKFATAGQGKLNLIGLDDYVAAIQQLGERHPWLDTSRVGIQGGSYGGYAAIRAMLEFPDVFTVGVAGVPFCSVHNMYPDYHWTGWHGAPDYGDGQGERPDATARPKNYLAMDATLQVEKLKGPLLMIAGELDENCPVGPIMQLYAAAVEADAPMELVLQPNSNHYTTRRTRYVMRKVMDYFCRHLLAEEPPRAFRFELLTQDPEPASRETAW